MLATTTKTLTEELALLNPRKVKARSSARINMERLSGSMSALDKIQSLIAKLESGDSKFILEFENEFIEFEREYDKESARFKVEEMVDRISATFVPTRWFVLNDDGKWEECNSSDEVYNYYESKRINE